ncbi:MAG: FecR family protein [Gemmatimonadaceae bacterium]
MRVDEWLVPAGEPRELTSAEIEEALAADPEVTLISDYLARALTPEQAAEVERRLQDDAGFRSRVAPIIEAWKAWPTVAEMTIPEEQLAESWQRFLAKAAWRGDARRSGAAGHDAGRGDDRSTLRRLRRWQLAAGLLLMVGLPLSIGGTLWVQARRLPLTVHMEESSARDFKIVRLEGRGWVTLTPESRLTWKDGTGANGERELYLDGSATFRLEHVTSGQYVVVTPSARIHVTGTEFEVRVEDPATTRVSVRSGTVVLAPRGPRVGAYLELRVGETGEVTWDDIPRRVR